MAGFLSRLFRRLRGGDAWDDSEDAGAGAAERRFLHESVDDRQAEGFAEEHLGGGDPGGRFDDER